jgi:hypothetical protein
VRKIIIAFFGVLISCGVALCAEDRPPAAQNIDAFLGKPATTGCNDTYPYWVAITGQNIGACVSKDEICRDGFLNMSVPHPYKKDTKVIVSRGLDARDTLYPISEVLTKVCGDSSAICESTSNLCRGSVPPPQYTIFYDCNDGSNRWAADSVDVGTSITIIGKGNCVNGDKTFVNWKVSPVPSGGFGVYAAGSRFTGSQPITYTMTAQWQGGGVPSSLGGSVTITGKAQVGEILEGADQTTGGMGRPRYIWLRNGIEVPSSADNTNYELTNDDLIDPTGRGGEVYMTLKVSYDNGYMISARPVGPILPAVGNDKIDDKWKEISALNRKFTADGWKDKNGNFNWARLGVDVAAGTVVGAGAGILTHSLVKKSQLKKGYESIQCVYGGGNATAAYDEMFIVR